MYSYRLLFLAVWFANSTALAASPPDDPASHAPLYESAFSGYRAFTQDPVASWRAVNEAIAGSGGHAGHAVSPAAAEPHADHDMPEMKND